MPLNVEQVRWDKDDTFRDQVYAHLMMGCCQRVAMHNAKSGGYPHEVALEGAVIRHVQKLWSPPPPWVHEAMRRLSAELSCKKVEAGGSLRLKVAFAAPMASPGSNIFYAKTLYGGVG